MTVCVCLCAVYLIEQKDYFYYHPGKCQVSAAFCCFHSDYLHLLSRLKRFTFNAQYPPDAEMPCCGGDIWKGKKREQFVSLKPRQATSYVLVPPKQQREITVVTTLSISSRVWCNMTSVDCTQRSQVYQAVMPGPVLSKRCRTKAM